MCVYRSDNGDGFFCRIENLAPVELDYCVNCPYIREEKRGFCAFLLASDRRGDGLFKRVCARDQRTISLEECVDCTDHT